MVWQMYGVGGASRPVNHPSQFPAKTHDAGMKLEQDTIHRQQYERFITIAACLGLLL